MINFQSYASGSSGNLHSISDGETTIMIECGIPWKKVQEFFGFQTSKVSAVVLSHEHKDHSGWVHHAAKAGIDVYLLPETRSAMVLNGHRYHEIDFKTTYQIGTIKVRAFGLQHDVPICGFLFAAGGEKAIYITDSFYCKPKFPTLDLIAIECNYSIETMAKDLNLERKKRLYSSHFSLENVKRFLAGCDLSRTREIHLIHISKENGDPEYFKAEIEKATGKPTSAK
ncbi:MAG: MBL fold metallo-hydrolase [Proteobacteria bacterium]|nr:MBL fold metallo-hydrolase [Pseudomonadota bacterium]MBU4470274.1 MBL fold metallo-hydrolase [Pseudomonadota bacterium]MCG2752687.1 MBL fold metallo-hydrolase [Desulfobacteraceae bacterium]